MRIDAVLLMAKLLYFQGLRRTSKTHKPDLVSFVSLAVFSCAISGVYNSVVRLMPHITSHISDNFN